MHDDHHELVR